MTFVGRETWVDFLVFNMVDFDIILGMDWFALNYAVLDYFGKIATLSSPGVLRITWRVRFIRVLRGFYLMFKLVDWLRRDVYLIWIIFIILVVFHLLLEFCSCCP